MPIYEYQCTACGHRLDELQKFSDAPLTDCPECHAAALQKLVSATSFQLKGTGWYATDFRHKDQSESKKEAVSVASSPSTEATTSASTTDVAST